MCLQIGAESQAHPEMEGDGFINIRTDMLKICFLSGLLDVYQKKLREIPGVRYVRKGTASCKAAESS